MFATFILVLSYRYDRVTASLWIRYPGILLGEGIQLTSVRLQIILWLRNANMLIATIGASSNRVCATCPTVATGEALPSLLGHHNSDRTAAVGHLPIATEGFEPLV
jgi:hypothetical protein